LKETLHPKAFQLLAGLRRGELAPNLSQNPWFVESAVNEIIAKRMVKKQQMRWNRYTVQNFLDVRTHVLNGTLEDAFRHSHKAFRPIAETSRLAASA
jgi:F0F1-type ATP synthase membrane subunit a